MGEMGQVISSGSTTALVYAVIIGAGTLVGILGRQWAILGAALKAERARADAEVARRRKAEDAADATIDKLREQIRQLLDQSASQGREIARLSDQVAAQAREIAALRAQLEATP